MQNSDDERQTFVNQNEEDRVDDGDVQVRIHLNRRPHESSSQTTGEMLYNLANIPSDHQLYREVRGNREDELINNDKDIIHLIEDEHFYSTESNNCAIRIIVNGRSKVVENRELTFNQIIGLADNLSPGTEVIYTITYRRGPDADPEGTLVAGELVIIKEGMIFNVTATNKS